MVFKAEYDGNNTFQGEPITQVPQVSKQTVDLHRLYIAVMKRGGFEQVCQIKSYKRCLASC